MDANCIRNKVREMKQYIGDEKRRIGFDQSRAGVSRQGDVPSQLNRIKQTTEARNRELGQSMMEECVDKKKLEKKIKHN